MNHITFEWDLAKNETNLQKHGVSFEEAKSVFYDDFARVIHDPDHSPDEDRFIIMGMSKRANILIVVHCYLSNNEIIRIISARKAARSERKQYQESLK
jgi:uncharacterized protein